MSRRRHRGGFLGEDDGDPLSVVVNLFDVAMVFAVSLMVAMVMHMNMTCLLYTSPSPRDS